MSVIFVPMLGTGHFRFTDVNDYGERLTRYLVIALFVVGLTMIATA